MIYSFFVLKKRNILLKSNKNAQKDDLWIFMKKRINNIQKLKDINDFIFVKTCWHGKGKSNKIKVKVIGNTEEIKSKLGDYKYALRSVNVGQYANLINNLISFRDGPPNKYLDSVLHINKTTFFEPLMELNKSEVIQMKDYFSRQFKLNSDQN